MSWNWRDPALRVLVLWWRLTRPRTVGVRGIVTDDEGRILFVRHGYGARTWYLPGGGSSGSETADEALVREMREETGVQVEVTRLVGVYLWMVAYKRDHIFVFACRRLGGEMRADGTEISAAGWYPLDALPEPLTPGTRAVLEHWRTGYTGYGRWPEGDATRAAS